MTGASRLPDWQEMEMDTSPEVDEVWFQLWRKVPGWRKLELLEGLNRSARALVLMGVRQRQPDATDDELRRQMADLLARALAEAPHE